MPSDQELSASSDPSEHALIQQWIDTQRHELQIKSEELELRGKELDHNRALAEKSIDAQLKDRNEERAWLHSVIKNTLITIVLSLFSFH